MPSQLIIYLMASVAVAGVAWAGYSAIYNRGYSACEAVVQQDNLQTAADAHKTYLAAVARGDALSAKLATTQRRLNETKSEYLAYANSITGNCPAELGVFLAAKETSAARAPEAASPSASTAAPLAASVIAANIAENRGRFEANYAQCAALIDWHTQAYLTSEAK